LPEKQLWDLGKPKRRQLIMQESKKKTDEFKISREQMVKFLNEDLSREYQAITGYI
jgi:hypothetical protein